MISKQPSRRIYHFCPKCMRSFERIGELIRHIELCNSECLDCGSTGHDTGSNTCPGPLDDRQP
jgi:uncharacterized Zn finger protein